MPNMKDILKGILSWSFFFSVMGLSVLSSQAATTVITFPGPSGISPSDKFSVTVNGMPSFTYKSNAQADTWKPLDAASWTTFDFSGGSVTVVVTKLTGSMGDVEIRPKSYGITPTIVDASTVSFILTRPRKVSVEFSGDPRQALFVFAGAPEVNPPSEGDPNVVYFGPGIHDVGNNYQLPPGKTCYLAGGAWVIGQFRGGGDNTRITGRGILYGGAYPHVDGPGCIFLWANNVTMEGITIVESPGYSAVGGTTYRDLREICWQLNTDGISPIDSRAITVTDCFILNYDDQLIVRDCALSASNCVFYPMKGSTIQISATVNTSTIGPSLIKNNDVIHFVCADNYEGIPAVISMNHGGRGNLSDITIEDLRVDSMDGPYSAFCSLRLSPNAWTSVPVNEIGSLNNVIIRNVTMNGQTSGNRILGLSASQKITNIHFENVFVNGVPLLSVADANMSTNQYTGNITFSATTPHGVPYSWLIDNGIPSDQPQAENDDPDADGMVTWKEYFAGTNPNVKGSAFEVLSLGANGSLEWFGTTNSGVMNGFMMYRSTNLLSGWQVVASNLTRSASGTNTWTDPTPPLSPCVFYRPALSALAL